MGDRAKEYFQALQRAIDEDEEDEIIDISSQLLNFIPKDEETRKCRAIAYMKTGRFTEAASDLELLKNVDFEKCFCLYGQGKYSECLTFIRGLPPQVMKEDRWERLLEQVYFRLDDSQGMKELYARQDFTDLGEDDDDREERLVNISAGLALMGDAERALSLLDVKTARVEHIYNTVTACVDAKMYEKATELIEIGMTKAKPGSTYAQLFGLLKVQIKAATEPESATNEYLAVVEDEDNNPYVRTVAASNYVTLTVDSSSHLAKKKMSFFDDNDKYSTYRKAEFEPFVINRFLLLHKIGQPNKVKALIEFAKKLPNFDKLILEAFDRTIDPTGAANSEFSPLFTAQALINQNKFAEAADHLAASPLSKHPRTIAVVTELYLTAYKMDMTNGMAAEAKQKLDGAVAFLGRVPCTLPSFYEFASMFCFNNGYHKEATSWAEKMSRSARATAVQAVAFSETDIEMAERYASRLTIPTIAAAELDALEATPLTKAEDTSENQKAEFVMFDVLGKRKKKFPLSEMSPEKLKKLKDKKRKRRRLQKPANYDPDKKTDPERWIPMSKRAAGKRKKKLNQQKQQKQQQYKQQKKKAGKKR